jgi:hypothetical protein
MRSLYKLVEDAAEEKKDLELKDFLDEREVPFSKFNQLFERKEDISL